MKKIEKFEDDVPGAPVIFEPWDDFYSTVAKIAAEHPHRGDDDELAFNELEPIVERFLTVANFAEDINHNLYRIVAWLLLFQQRWAQEGKPGQPLSGADDPKLNSVFNQLLYHVWGFKRGSHSETNDVHMLVDVEPDDISPYIVAEKIAGDDYVFVSSCYCHELVPVNIRNKLLSTAELYAAVPALMEEEDHGN
jgi:hypothetical protein